MVIRNKCYNTCFYLHDRFSIQQLFLLFPYFSVWIYTMTSVSRGRHSRDHMVVGYISFLYISDCSLQSEMYRKLMHPTTIWSRLWWPLVSRIDSLQSEMYRKLMYPTTIWSWLWWPLVSMYYMSFTSGLQHTYDQLLTISYYMDMQGSL
jgi:hypothetical protein